MMCGPWHGADTEVEQEKDSIFNIVTNCERFDVPCISRLLTYLKCSRANTNAFRSRQELRAAKHVVHPPAARGYPARPHGPAPTAFVPVGCALWHPPYRRARIPRQVSPDTVLLEVEGFGRTPSGHQTLRQTPETLRWVAQDGDHWRNRKVPKPNEYEASRQIKTPPRRVAKLRLVAGGDHKTA